MSLEDDLIEAANIVGLEGAKLDVSRWELLNDEDPDGLVVGRNDRGIIMVAMPRADYDAMKAAHKESVP